MNELVRQNRPRKWLKRLAVIGAVLVGLGLAGGGMALATGYDPIRLFVTLDADGNGVVLDENGNPTGVEARFVPAEGGGVEATITTNQPGTYEVILVPPGGSAAPK